MDTPDKEVQTPVIDQLVHDGVELDRHYVHKVRQCGIHAIVLTWSLVACGQ